MPIVEYLCWTNVALDLVTEFQNLTYKKTIKILFPDSKLLPGLVFIYNVLTCHAHIFSAAGLAW